MSDVISALINGNTVDYEGTPTNKNGENIGTDKLGKDAFLTLLVTQLQHQDPLNPSSDTEFIGQLAQFSSLEEMQNMTQQLSNLSAKSQMSQALDLVGKNVIIQNADGSFKAGYVGYIEMVEGVPHLAIDEELYSIDLLDTVVDEKYLEMIMNQESKESTETDKDTDQENKEEDKDTDEVE